MKFDLYKKRLSCPLLPLVRALTPAQRAVLRNPPDAAHHRRLRDRLFCGQACRSSLVSGAETMGRLDLMLRSPRPRSAATSLTIPRMTDYAKRGVQDFYCLLTILTKEISCDVDAASERRIGQSLHFSNWLQHSVSCFLKVPFPVSAFGTP